MELIKCLFVQEKQLWHSASGGRRIRSLRYTVSLTPAWHESYFQKTAKRKAREKQPQTYGVLPSQAGDLHALLLGEAREGGRLSPPVPFAGSDSNLCSSRAVEGHSVS